MSTLQHVYVKTNGITLHTVQAGPADGPLVILLHGFPEFWFAWRKQIDALANAGYRVIAPDQRGYNLSDKPRGIAQYNLDTLALDIVGLIDAAGVKKAHIVGHDWGGGVAWWLALKYPNRVQKLVTMNSPHPLVFSKFLRENPDQRRKSWYMFFFQLPFLPELVLTVKEHRALAESLQQSALPGTFTHDDIAQYREAWRRPDAIKSMLHWYRAMIQARPQQLENIRATMPALIIWGKRDHVLKAELVPPSAALCDEPREVIFDEATHWVQHDMAEHVNVLLCEFLN